MTRPALWTKAFPDQMSKKREKKKWIRPITIKRKAEAKLYKVLRKTFLQEHPCCYVCINFGPIGVVRKSTEVHHKKGRNGKWLNQTEHWMALCSEHHRYIHDHPDWAYKNNLLERRT